MFSSKTGWVAVIVAIIGALTAVDTLPLVTTFINGVAGEHAAQVTGSVLTIIATVVAKMSHSTSTPPATTPTVEPPTQ